MNKPDPIIDNFNSFDNLYEQILLHGPNECDFILDEDNVWKRLELKWLLDYF